MKYELVNPRKLCYGDGEVTVHQIRSLTEFICKDSIDGERCIPAGQIGGCVQGEHNLSQYDTSWIGTGSMVIDESKVSGDGTFIGHNRCCISGKSIIQGGACIEDQSEIHDSVIVGGEVFGSKISGSQCFLRFADRLLRCTLDHCKIETGEWTPLVEFTDIEAYLTHFIKKGFTSRINKDDDKNNPQKIASCQITDSTIELDPGTIMTYSEIDQAKITGKVHLSIATIRGSEIRGLVYNPLESPDYRDWLRQSDNIINLPTSAISGIRLVAFGRDRIEHYRISDPGGKYIELSPNTNFFHLKITTEEGRLAIAPHRL